MNTLSLLILMEEQVRFQQVFRNALGQNVTSVRPFQRVLAILLKAGTQRKMEAERHITRAKLTILIKMVELSRYMPSGNIIPFQSKFRKFSQATIPVNHNSELNATVLQQETLQLNLTAVSIIFRIS